MPGAAAEWWIHQQNGTPMGPLSTDEVLRRIAAGAIQRNTLACDGPGRRWQPVGTFPALAAAFGAPPAPPPGVVAAARGYAPPGVGGVPGGPPPPPPPPPQMHRTPARHGAPAQPPSSPKPIVAQQPPPPPPLPRVRKPVSEPPPPPAPQADSSRPLPTFSVPPAAQLPEPGAAVPPSAPRRAGPEPQRASAPGGHDTALPGPLEPGTVLADRYRVERHLARGGFSDLYLALDQVLDHHVTLKVPFPYDDAGFLESLVRSTCSAWERAGDAAPGLIVRLKGLVPLEVSGRRTTMIVMEFMPGGTLDDFARAKDGGRPRTAQQLDAVLRMFLQGCHAVRAIHRLGMLHRDIKPANFLLDASQRACKLADFETIGATGEGDDATVGTGAYRAPECHAGRHSPASELFALGATLFQLLTGELPFADAHGARRDVAPDVVSLNPMVPDELSLLVARCLDPDPARRPRSVQNLTEDLARIGVGEETTAAAPAGLARLLLSALPPEDITTLASELERRGLRSVGATMAERSADLVEEYCYTTAPEEVLGDSCTERQLHTLAKALDLPTSEASPKTDQVERIIAALGFLPPDRHVPGLEAARSRLVRLGFELSQVASLDDVLGNLRSSFSTVKKAVDVLARFYAQLLFGSGAKSALAQLSGAKIQDRLAIGQLAVALRALCTTPPTVRLSRRVAQAFSWPLLPAEWFDRLDRLVAVRNDVVQRHGELTFAIAQALAHQTLAEASELIAFAASSPHAPGVLRVVGRQQDASGRNAYLARDDAGQFERLLSPLPLSVGRTYLFHPLGRPVRVNPVLFPFELD